MTKKNRNMYIDIIKGLLITLVVVGHLPYFDYNSRTLTLIYSFHMHSFLIIGGILSHVNSKTKFTDVIKKRFKSTLLLYFIFHLISFIIVPLDSTERRLNALIVALRGIGIPADNAVNLPLWFLTFYFVAMVLFELIEVLSYKIKNMLKNKVSLNDSYSMIAIIDLIFVSLIMSISFYYARILKAPRLPYNIEIAGFCLGFIFFGKMLGVYANDIIVKIKKSNFNKIAVSIVFIFIISIIFFIWYTYSMKNGRIDLNARDYKNAFLMYVDAILGFIIISFVAYIIYLIPIINQIVSTIGENSMYILAYHLPSTVVTYNFIIPLIGPIIGNLIATNSIYSVSLLTFLGVSLSLIMAFLHRKLRFPA